MTPEQFNEAIIELHRTLPKDDFNREAVTLILNTFVPLGYAGLALYLVAEK